MKSLTLALLSVLFIIGCNRGKVDSNLIEQGLIMTSEPLDTCFCDSLAKDDEGRFLQRDQLFTGVCVYNYPETDVKYMVKGILGGKLHGKVIYYDQTGKVLMEEVYENGTKKRTGDGAPIVCDCSELEKKELVGATISRWFLDEIPFSGKCIKKYPETDQTYLEANYKNGLPDGYTIYYGQDGQTLYMEKYVNGDLIKILHD